ncbi:MAG: MFS transporter [Deltaproteobacteria bacterium]|nr:MFS transporter [Deltaproteobacteria bacterium]
MDEKPEKAGFYGWKNVVLWCVIIGMNGFGLYSYTIVFPSMLKELGWDRGPASLALTIMIIMIGALSPVVALSINRFGNKKTIRFGLIGVMVSMILVGTIVTEIWMWTLIWGIMVPFGFLFGGFIPVFSNAMLWFNIRRATVIGILATALAVGGFISQPFCTWLIGITGAWQAGWFAVAAAGALAFIVSFFLVEKPEDIGQFPDGIDPADIKSASEEKTTAPKTYRSSVDWPLKEIVKTPVIWLLVLVTIGYMQALILVTTHGVMHFTDLGFTSMQAASVMSVTILFSGLAGLPMGALGDRIEPRWITSAALFVMLLMFLGLWKAPSLWSLMAAGSVFGFCYGTINVVLPALEGNYYGPESFPQINAILGPIGVVGTSIVPFVAGNIVDKTGSYDLAFIMVGFVLLGGFICALLLKPPVPQFAVPGANPKPSQAAYDEKL